MERPWVKPTFEETDVNGECTAYAVAGRSRRREGSAPCRGTGVGGSDRSRRPHGQGADATIVLGCNDEVIGHAGLVAGYGGGRRIPAMELRLPQLPGGPVGRVRHFSPGSDVRRRQRRRPEMVPRGGLPGHPLPDRVVVHSR